MTKKQKKEIVEEFEQRLFNEIGHDFGILKSQSLDHAMHVYKKANRILREELLKL